MKLNKIVPYICLAICTFLCFYISVEVIVAIKNDKPVSLFSYSISYVPTDSMKDEIMPGDYVLFKKTSFEQIDVEDIIVYKSKTGQMEGKYIIHRVIEEYDDYFVTKGDNNALPDDGDITSDMIVGEYVKVVKFVGFIIKHKTVIVVLLFGTVFITLLSQYVTNYMKKKKEENEKEQETNKEVLLEQLKREILEEELSKIKDSKK